MNTVEPIRSLNLILDIESYLKEKNKRDYVLFMFGLYSGLRISDILPLKVRDVKEAKYLSIREKKTNKEKRLPINEELKQIIKEYVKGRKDYEYLFRRSEKTNIPITRQRVWQILNETAEFFEYKEKIGCHTLRKTFGYWLYENTKDIAGIMDILNHSDVSITKRYIGITQDKTDSLMNGLSFAKKR